MTFADAWEQIGYAHYSWHVLANVMGFNPQVCPATARDMWEAAKRAEPVEPQP